LSADRRRVATPTSGKNYYLNRGEMMNRRRKLLIAFGLGAPVLSAFICALWLSESDCPRFALTEALSPSTMVELPVPPGCSPASIQLTARYQDAISAWAKWHDLRIQHTLSCKVNLSVAEVNQFYSSEWKKKGFREDLREGSVGDEILGRHRAVVSVSLSPDGQSTQVVARMGIQSRYTRFRVAFNTCR